MGKGIRKFLFWTLAFQTILVFGETEYPPILASQPEREQHILRWLERYPWLAPTGISAHLPKYVAMQQTWLPQLYANPEFIELLKNRPELVSLKVQSVNYEEGEVSVLESKAITSFREEVRKTIRTNEAYEDLDSLNEIFKAKLAAHAESNARAIITGLIHCLPNAQRSDFYKIAEPRKQLKALQKEALLTDEIIQQKFRAEGKLAALTLSKDALFKQAHEWLAQEQELLSLLRVKLFLLTLKNSIEDVEHLLNSAPDSSFDPQDPKNEKALEKLSNELKELDSPLGDLLLKTFKTIGRTTERKKLAKYQHLFTIQEMPPEIGIYRGVIGGDCSLTTSYAFPFSPMERVYFLFDPNGQPIRAYISATVVEVDGRRTLYVHDIGGPALTPDLQATSLHALYLARQVLDVEQLTLPTLVVRDANAGQEPTQNPALSQLIRDMDRFLIQKEVTHSYLDTNVRTFLGSQKESTLQYDSPEYNKAGLVFSPSKKILDELHIKTNVSEKDAPPKETKALTKKDSFLRLLDLLAGEENPELFFEGLGFDKAEVERILGIINNEKRLTLADYYTSVTEEFKKHEIGWSQKFLKRNARYFIFGHLVAADAANSPDALMQERTLHYVIETVKRGRVRDIAYKLIEKNPTFFNQNKTFQEYLSGLALHGEENLRRVTLLLQAGVNLEWILAGSRNERLAELSRSHKSELLILTMKALKNSAPGSDELIQLYSAALNNEKHDNDEASLFAISELLNIQIENKNILASLYQTARRDTNDQIAYRAALTLLRNGNRDEKILKLIQKHLQNAEILDALRIEGAKFLEEHDCKTALAEESKESA